MMAEALKPLHDPKLRDLLVNLKRSHEQVIDEVSQDELLEAGFDAHALEKAQALITSFKDFIESHKDELEAIQILYSRPYKAGLRYRQVKDLAAALKNPPLGATPDRVWKAYEAAEPEAVQGKGGTALVDLIALVRHALDPQEPIIPFARTVEERYQKWLAEQGQKGRHLHRRAAGMARRDQGPHRHEPADRGGRLRVRAVQSGRGSGAGPRTVRGTPAGDP